MKDWKFWLAKTIIRIELFYKEWHAFAILLAVGLTFIVALGTLMNCADVSVSVGFWLVLKRALVAFFWSTIITYGCWEAKNGAIKLLYWARNYENSTANYR